MADPGFIKVVFCHVMLTVSWHLNSTYWHLKIAWDIFRANVWRKVVYWICSRVRFMTDSLWVVNLYFCITVIIINSVLNASYRKYFVLRHQRRWKWETAANKWRRFQRVPKLTVKESRVLELFSHGWPHQDFTEADGPQHCDSAITVMAHQLHCTFNQA